jgi:hypothetical protein
MTGKILDSGAPIALVLILPIALVVVVLYAAWPLLLLLIALIIAWKIWENYQWQKWSKQVNPFFYQLIKDNQGCLTVMDLSLKANLSGRAARKFLDKKVEEYGTQRKEIEDKGTVYYFPTVSALGSIFDDSEPELESEELVHKETPELAQQSPNFQVSEIAPLVEAENDQHSADLESKIDESGEKAAEYPSQTSSETKIEVEKGLEDSEDYLAEEAEEGLETEEDFVSQHDLNHQHKHSLALIQAELAKRLDLNPSTVGRRKSDPDFSQWSQSKDPQGIAWKYVPQTKMFVPADVQAESS